MGQHNGRWCSGGLSFFFLGLQHDDYQVEESLSIDNTLWANTVIASGRALGVVIYTGKETRSVMNNNKPRYKMGVFDKELNTIVKVGDHQSK